MPMYDYHVPTLIHHPHHTTLLTIPVVTTTPYRARRIAQLIATLTLAPQGHSKPFSRDSAVDEGFSTSETETP